MKEADTIKISFIGDIFPGERAFTLKYGIKTQFENHNGRTWINKVKTILGDCDIVVGNLESPLIEESKSVKKTFWGNPSFAFFLKECGINVLNVANNHIMEQGDAGIKNTIDSLINAQLGVVGNIVNFTSNIHYLNVKGIKIGIAGFSNVDLHKIQNNGHFAILNEQNVLNTIETMKQQSVDLKILCLHWGNEYIHIPSIEQREMAYKFIDAGADIIAGHHPHVIQPYEKYKNGHVFYSLGNFMFDLIQSKKFSIGLIATIELNKNKVLDIKLSGIKLSYKNLLESITKYEFDKYYSKILNKYNKIKSLPAKQYEQIYISSLKKNHLNERLFMKTSLFNEFLRIKVKDKIQLIFNIFRFLKEK